MFSSLVYSLGSAIVFVFVVKGYRLTGRGRVREGVGLGMKRKVDF